MVPGFVRVSVKGQQCQRFVNLCRGREMDLKRIIRTGETELQLTMKVADFLQISPLRRKTGVHIHILKKKGPLFFLLFCKRRKMIPAGFLAVCCLLFFLSGRVWNVEIRGNILNPTPQLMSFLKEQGVCFGVHLQIPCEENFRRSSGCLPDFRERACVLISGRELPEKKQSRKKDPAVCFQLWTV